MIKIPIVLLILMLITGCSTISNNEINRITTGIKNSPGSNVVKKETINGYYKDVFRATTAVFNDLSISIPKKDFAEKEILAIAYVAKAFAPSAGSERYLVNFIPQEGSVIIEIRMIPIKYTYDGDFIIERIRKEMDLQEQFN